jgi:hypothetical protein
MKAENSSKTSANITRLHGVKPQKTLSEYEGGKFFQNVRKHYQITRRHFPEDINFTFLITQATPLAQPPTEETLSSIPEQIVICVA